MHVRRALPSDSAYVLAWRNDPQARQSSRNSEVIDSGTHDPWFIAVLADSDRHLFIGEIEPGEAIGQVRFDKLSSGTSDYEVSISIAAEARGRGLSLPLLTAAEGQLLNAVHATKLFAFVNDSNLASQRLFESAGYSIGESSTLDGGHWWTKELND